MNGQNSTASQCDLAAWLQPRCPCVFLTAQVCQRNAFVAPLQCPSQLHSVLCSRLVLFCECIFVHVLLMAPQRSAWAVLCHLLAVPSAVTGSLQLFGVTPQLHHINTCRFMAVDHGIRSVQHVCMASLVSAEWLQAFVWWLWELPAVLCEPSVTLLTTHDLGCILQSFV
jgi:hypothetical protein